jgi:DHA2 family multidrug resistance protein
MGVVLIGTFMSILDTTIVNVALPQIGIDLNATANIEWVVSGYLLAIGVSQPVTGWLADKIGRKRVFTLSLGFFAVGSLLAALSPNLYFLIGFRILQGLGGGAMMPVGLAMVYELFPPHQRGTAMGIWGIAAMAAPAIGPVLGGFIVTAISWRWLFVINVPLGIAGVIAATVLLRDIGYREDRKFDIKGFAFISTGLVCWLLAFSQASEWGWGSGRIIGLLVAGTALAICFAVVEIRIHHPLIEMRMFRVPVFSLTIFIAALLTISQYGSLVFIPLELETLRHLSAFQVGLILTPSALGAAVTNPFGGRLADRVGSRTPALIGMGVLCLAMLGLANLRADTPIWLIMVILAFRGLGNGLAMMPMMVAAMNSVPGRFVAPAAAVRSLNRQIAGALGIAVLSTIVASQIGSISAVNVTGISVPSIQNAYNLVFWIGFAGLVGCFILCFFLPNQEKTREMQLARLKEQEEMGAAGMFGHLDMGE